MKPKYICTNPECGWAGDHAVVLPSFPADKECPECGSDAVELVKMVALVDDIQKMYGKSEAAISNLDSGIKLVSDSLKVVKEFSELTVKEL